MLGADHPLVLKNLASLAVVLGRARATTDGRAAPTSKRWTVCVAVLGDRASRHSRHTAMGFAYVLLQLGDLNGAETQLTNAPSTIDRARRGVRHDSRLRRREPGIRARTRAVAFAEAEAAYREALAGLTAIPGALAYVAVRSAGPQRNVLVDLWAASTRRRRCWRPPRRACGQESGRVSGLRHARSRPCVGGRPGARVGSLCETPRRCSRQRSSSSSASRDHKDLQVTAHAAGAGSSSIRGAVSLRAPRSIASALAASGGRDRSVGVGRLRARRIGAR